MAAVWQVAGRLAGRLRIAVLHKHVNVMGLVALRRTAVRGGGRGTLGAVAPHYARWGQPTGCRTLRATSFGGERGFLTGGGGRGGGGRGGGGFLLGGGGDFLLGGGGRRLDPPERPPGRPPPPMAINWHCAEPGATWPGEKRLA